MSKRLFELILAIKYRCQGNEEQIQEEMGLSQAEFNGLIVLDEDRVMSGCAFATGMGLSPSRGSRVLSKLVTNGYVKARPSTKDRRAVVVSLTPKGRRTRRRMTERMAACEDRIRRRLDEKKLQQVTHALELLEAAL
ncbi:MAG: winged helix DNA-binding protein [Sedimentisphaerales bacterium]|nr:winged helix DNA-binding protein [Sedimentisphaerales bacterium]